jgi:two-component system chemotaxis response regulator CheB
VYTTDSMFAAHTDAVDRALWFALKALEERVALTRKLAQRARVRQQAWVARTFEERATAAEEHAAAVRDVLSTRTAAQAVPDHTVDDNPEPATVAKEQE